MSRLTKPLDQAATLMLKKFINAPTLQVMYRVPIVNTKWVYEHERMAFFSTNILSYEVLTSTSYYNTDTEVLRMITKFMKSRQKIYKFRKNT